MSADALISRLEGVRRRGPGAWVARCPAHEDRSPSLTVSEVSDGRVLVHCFAGCSFDEIVGAAGVDMDEMFPPSEHDKSAPLTRRFNAHAVLDAVANEAAIVAIYASDMQRGVALQPSDHERLGIAVRRLSEASRLANG